jgi:hypothetical protein
MRIEEGDPDPTVTDKPEFRRLSGLFSFNPLAFRRLVHSESVEVGAMTGATPVPRLFEYPDAATAWVWGIYASALGRYPDPLGLKMHLGFLRRGGTPSQLFRSVVRSPEARGRVCVLDLDEIFVVGCFLTALGRHPADHEIDCQAKVLKTVTPDALLSEILGSDEATSAIRLPPAPVSRPRVVAEAVQLLVTGRPPSPAITDQYAARIEAGATTLQIVRAAMSASGRVRRYMSLIQAQSIARQVEVEATSRAALAEIEAGRQWQWAMMHEGNRS